MAVGRNQLPETTIGESLRPNPFVDVSKDPLTGEWRVQGQDGGGGGGGNGSGLPPDLLRDINSVNAASAGKGMDPLTIAMLGLSGIEGLDKLMNMFGGEEGDFASFEGERPGGVSIDPRDLLMHGLLSAGRAGEKFEQFASQPVRLRSAFAQSPQAIKGSQWGGPFDIGGGFGQDPALSDPSMLELEGFDFTGIMPQLAAKPAKGPQLRAAGGPPPDDSDDALAALDLLNPRRG